MTETQDDPGGEDNPPEGFVLSERRGPFTTHNGPFYHKLDGETFVQGFRARERHCNGLGIVHGGLLMSFADSLLAAAIWRGTGQRLVTIRMTSDFLNMAKPGEWVEGISHLRHADGTIAQASARIYVSSRTVLTASGIFKLMGRRSS